MPIRFVDDKKEKYQSHEAHLESDATAPMSHWSFDAVGYGATKGEALGNLCQALSEIEGKLEDTRKVFHSSRAS